MRRLCVSQTQLLLVICATFLVYLAILPRWVERLDPLTGDEPFYVMTAISILEDRDLNEINNYEVVRIQSDGGIRVLYRFDERLTPPDPLPADWQGWPAAPSVVGPHAATTEREGYYTKHGLGLSFLIAIPWAVGGRIGADLLIMFSGALLAGQMFLMGRETGLRALGAGILAVGLAVVMPIGPYALLLFPEVPAALLLVYAVRRLAAGTSTNTQWALTGMAIGFLPWLHQRFIGTSVVLSVIVLVMMIQRRQFRLAAGALAPIGLLGITLVAYNVWLYGSPVQSTDDHAGFHGPGETFNAAAGLALDAQWGLFVAAPVTALAMALTPCWISRARRTALIAIAAALPYLAIVSAYQVWWGEWGPPARYLVPLAPFAVGPLAAWLASGGVFRVAATVLFWTVGAFVTLLGYVDPQRFYHHPDGVNKLFARFDELIGTAMHEILVSFQPFARDPAGERLWLAASVATMLAAAMLLMNRNLLPRQR